jgi:hypothetical protein
MHTGESSPRKSAPQVRRDGWTAERQLVFLETLARTRSVAQAAARAGMSRESAYRLRARPVGALFAAAWDKTLARRSQTRLAPTVRTRLRRVENLTNPPKVTKVMKVMTPRLRGVPAQAT